MPAVSTSTTLASVDDQRRVDRVAGRAGELGDDHPLLAEEAVDERGLADVRAADHAQGGSRPRRAPGSPRGEQLDDPVEQVAGAESLCGGHGERLAEAEAWKSAASGISATVSHLLAATITGSGERRSRSAISSIPGPHAGAGVDDEHRDLRVGEPACA